MNFGKDSQRFISAHGTDRFSPIFRHWNQNIVYILMRIPEGFAKLVNIHGSVDFSGFTQILQPDDIFYPIAVWML